MNQARPEVRDVLDVYLLVQTENGRAAEAAMLLGGLPEVSSVERVEGPYDLVVRARFGDADELARFLREDVRRAPGVLRALPCAALAAGVPG
jgi:DNA-binding Lrp family transcriptional regulator